MHKHKKKINNLDESGFASIVIALILIVILALLVVGFSQMARREQQNALDKQLAAQANDAAETGVNDIQHIVNESLNCDPVAGCPTATPPVPPLNSLISSAVPGTGGTENPNACLNTQGIVGLPNNTIDPADGVKYSCVLLDLVPPNLVFSGVSAGANENATFKVVPAASGLGSFQVNWGSGDSYYGMAPRASGGFPPLASWHSPAVVEFSITPLGNMSRQALINNTFSVFLYPSSGGGVNTVSYDTSNQGQIISGDCGGTGSYPCSVTINNINGTPGEQFLVHMLFYYDKSTNLSISTALDTSGSTKMYFEDGQAQIDVTGVAKNAAKRIQVRVPIKQPSTYPAYGVIGQNICKRFDTAPITTSNPNGTNYDTSTSTACNLNIP